MFAAYLDASGKHDASYRMLTVAGMPGPVKKWTRFEEQWESTLNDEGITMFHMTDFASSKKEFKSWKGDGDRRLRFVQRLTGVIKNNASKLIAASVDLEAWDALNRRYLLKEVYGSPYALCGLTAIGIVNKWAKRKTDHEPG
jgi:hypothetical protein